MSHKQDIIYNNSFSGWYPYLNTNKGLAIRITFWGEVDPLTWLFWCWSDEYTDEPTDAFKSWGFRFLGIDFEFLKVDQKSTVYQCPNCGWSPPEDFYFVEHGYACDCSDWVEDTKYGKVRTVLKSTMPDAVTYPKYTNVSHDNWAAIEYGGNPISWCETHKCAFCEEEFEYDNSNY